MPARKATVSARDDDNLSEDDLLTAAPRTVGAKTAKKKATKAAAGTKRKAPIAATMNEVKNGPRQALKDRTNVQAESRSDAQGDDVEEPAAKRAKSVKADARTKAKKRSDNTSSLQPKSRDVEVIDETIEPVVQNAIPEAPVARASSTRPSPPIVPITSHRATSVRATSVQPQQRREISVRADNIERGWRGGDTDLQRQLTAMTRDCENMRLKNQALEDLVKTKAESNFEQLKKEADEKSRRADDLIASLRKEIAVLRKSWSSTSSEATSLQKQVQTLTTNVEQTAAENDRLTGESAQLRSSIQACEKERQALEAKLMAARQQLNGGAASNNRTLPSTSSEAQRESRMKENLYTDLTGLIIRGVKRKDGEDEYDCIQTGRNGTLHFHLSVINENGASNPKTPSSYEDAEFSYEPFLDEDRDRELLEILPDYLSEDICFPRNHAVKFYSKIVESMTKRIVVEDEE